MLFHDADCMAKLKFSYWEWDFKTWQKLRENMWKLRMNITSHHDYPIVCFLMLRKAKHVYMFGSKTGYNKRWMAVVRNMIQCRRKDQMAAVCTANHLN